MLKLFQGEVVAPHIKIPHHLSQKLTGGLHKLMAVGYYYSPETGYVLMLPNAFKNNKESSSNDWELLISVHFMLERYVRDSLGKSKDNDRRFQMPEFGKNRGESFLDVLIRIRRFFKCNSNFFFTHIAKSCQQTGVIDWGATVAKTREIIVNRGADVLYPSPVYARHDIDVDHRLFVLFLSIVRYLKKYGCIITEDLEIELLSDKEIEGMCTSKRGCRLLKSIRDLYYSDMAIEMWQLCYDFFDRSVSLQDRAYEEYFYTMSFNLVFEKMIDTIIADPMASKKYSSAWARIDHVFEGPDPVIPNSKTLYVLDSKCYEEHESADTSVIRSNLNSDSDSAHKQKAYIDKIYGEAAKNGGKTKNGIILLDHVNKTHRFIPNCFIVPTGDTENPTIESCNYDNKKYGHMIGHFEYWHWKHKPLFGITTKYIFIFHIDLRSLMRVYSSKNLMVGSEFRNKIREKIFYEIKEFLLSQYDFNVADPSTGEQFFNVTAKLKSMD